MEGGERRCGWKGGCGDRGNKEGWGGKGVRVGIVGRVKGGCGRAGRGGDKGLRGGVGGSIYGECGFNRSGWGSIYGGVRA